MNSKTVVITPDSLQTWLMPDIIGDDSIKADDPMYGKSAWCTVEIPQNIKAGRYKLNFTATTR